jgi:hypothetical protein
MPAEKFTQIVSECKLDEEVIERVRPYYEKSQKVK